MSPVTVNEHYLEKVIDLAENMPVIATEDIYDARGNKLLAKGASVSRVLQEKLILHKLVRPIEASLCVKGGIDAGLIVKTAERLLVENQALQAIVAVSQGMGMSPLAMLSRLQFGNAVTMMLTIVQRGGAEALDHAVTVAITAACLAKHMQLTEELQQTCALAGLLHDVGELYIDPTYLQPGRPLLAHEWSHVAVHPRTGQMVIAEHEAYPPEVARAIAEHHERLDGSGYPRRLVGQAISPCGQVLAAAEAISGMLRTENALERAEVSLKLITTEHDRRIAGAISRARKRLRETSQYAWPLSSSAQCNSLYANIVAGLQATHALAASSALSPPTRALLERIGAKLALLQRAALSSGLDLTLIPEGGDGFDGLLVFEHAVATRELAWRMRDLSREIALAPCTAGERTILGSLDAILDPAHAAPVERAA